MKPLQCFALCFALQLVSSTSVGVPSTITLNAFDPESDWRFIPTLTTVLSLRQSAVCFVFFPLTCTSILRSVLDQGTPYVDTVFLFDLEPARQLGQSLPPMRLLLHPLA
jgi:hypothetical protein